MDNITGFNVTNKETGKRELRKYDFDSLGNKPKVNGEELTSEKELASKKQIDELKGDLANIPIERLIDIEIEINNIK